MTLDRIRADAMTSLTREPSGSWHASWMEGPARFNVNLRDADAGQLGAIVALGHGVAREAERRLAYLDYLASAEWQDKRARVLAAADGCAICTATAGLDVHHRTYARFGAEDDADLIALCRDCHDVFHDRRRLP